MMVTVTHTRHPKSSRKGANGASLADTAYERLEELIVTLKLPPGSVVTEAEIIKRIGIGRTPTREALQRLEVHRLVTPLPRHGIIIGELNVADHLSLLDTRRVLDRLIATRAARRANAEQRSAITQCASAIVLAAGSADLDKFMRIDHASDVILEAAARNPSAILATAPLHIHCRRFWYAFHQHADLVAAAGFHAALFRAVAEGDPEAAGTASDALIDYLEEFTRSTIEP
jgi:DNA-binding GntR family transcriptional regulator